MFICFSCFYYVFIVFFLFTSKKDNDCRIFELQLLNLAAFHFETSENDLSTD